MKALNPKTASVSLAAAGLAFVSGMALVSRQTMPQGVHLYKVAADTTATQSTSPAAPSISSPSSAAAPVRVTQTTDSTALSTSPASDTTTGSAPVAPQSNTAPAATAVSAELGDWSDPAPAGDGQPQGTTVQYVYCIWGYSDGSSQQAISKTLYTYPRHGSATVTAEQFGDVTCDVAHAPAAN